jgi:hypothetical protein
MLNGLLTREQVNGIFEAALSSIEAMDHADDPQLKVARALLDAQAQMILTADASPKPPL